MRAQAELAVMLTAAVVGVVLFLLRASSAILMIADVAAFPVWALLSFQSDRPRWASIVHGAALSVMVATGPPVFGTLLRNGG